jgi:Protein of unknown function (DUF2855)
MTQGWDLLVDRSDLANARIQETLAPRAGEGEVVLKVDRVGMTANNVTYALVGDTMNYWSFFPAPEGWGRVPLWGFANVVESKIDGIKEGDRFYGYWPPSSHLLVKPDNVSDRGFRDASDHRNDLPSIYNVYQAIGGDASYHPAREDIQIIYKPLFATSFVLDDFLADNDYYEAKTVVYSSASSKTAYGAAFCTRAREQRPKIVGLTSSGNVGFTKSLDIYDEVVSYDDIETLPNEPTVYADMSGNSELRARIHEHLGDDLKADSVVGATHHDISFGAGELPGPQPQFFFAPTQLSKRREDWGPGGVERNLGDAWTRFAPTVEDWVDVVESKGPEGLRDAWLEVYGNKSDPRKGHVIAL